MTLELIFPSAGPSTIEARNFYRYEYDVAGHLTHAVASRDDDGDGTTDHRVIGRFSGDILDYLGLGTTEIHDRAELLLG